MKKAIIGLSSLIVLTFVIILTINAQVNDPKDQKPCSGVTTAAGCPGLTGSKMPACSAEKSSAVNCPVAKCKEGKCDPANCKNICDPSVCKKSKSDPATCNLRCRGAASEMINAPMNCPRREAAKTGN